MALFAKQFSIFILLISLLSSHARESQYFNKASATTNDDVVSYSKQPETSPQQEQPETSPQQGQPEFLPDNEYGHGLYGHESGRLPPSATTTAAATFKHLPRNYNPVAYVTEPEDINDSATFTDDKKSFTANPENKNNFYGGAQNYYITPQEKEPEYRNSYYNGGSSFNSGANSFEPQGMSDTRWLENGKYYYDIEAEKYNSNHPYESLKRSSARNEYGNGENGYEIDGGKNGYQSQYEFQNEENNNWRP
ncbi:protein e6 [Phtheirospermum japonicum]|uniref:Protein e6 n=1 Tax=Phtheirospermum japonicum TaxID=374723 RepID=A0A830CUG7_9LAMI|nr:protein e6 [Phtheirospermum japonicum]